MKLVGSKTEEDFRDVLIKSHKSLFGGDSYQGLLQVLKTNFPEMKTAYFIRHTRNKVRTCIQCFDFDTIATIEISRYSQDEKPIVEIININDFKNGISKVEQIKLAVALDLAKKDIL